MKGKGNPQTDGLSSPTHVLARMEKQEKRKRTTAGQTQSNPRDVTRHFSGLESYFVLQSLRHHKSSCCKKENLEIKLAHLLYSLADFQARLEKTFSKSKLRSWGNNDFHIVLTLQSFTLEKRSLAFEGGQDVAHQNMTRWHEDYFDLKAIENQQL